MKLIGHRGARGEAPENTLGGFRHIIALGLKAVEFDVRLLQDHQLAVIHDHNFLRTTGRDQPVNQTSADQLIQTDNRVGWPAWQQAEPTPTLCEVLKSIKHFEHIEVEVKAVTDAKEAQLMVEKLHEVLAGWQDRVTITSFDLQVLEALKNAHSNFKRGLLVELPLGDVVIQFARQYDCDRIGLKDALTTQDLVEKIKYAGFKCSVWTVNDIERARQLATWGIDGLITDVTTAMIQANIQGLIL